MCREADRDKPVSFGRQNTETRIFLTSRNYFDIVAIKIGWETRILKESLVNSQIL
jgi:hypothetical protein